MARSSYIALCALILTVASAATVTNSFASSAFAAAPGKVFDGTPTTGADKTTWGVYTNAIFGPGTANTTVYAYGYTLDASPATSITSVASRALNATLLSNGTADSTMSSIIGSDVVYSTAITILTGPMAAVGLGTAALAYTAKDTTGCDQVYLAIFTGGTAAPATKAVTTHTCSHCTAGTASTGVGYVNVVNSIFYENATYYVAYTSTKYTETETNPTSITCTTGTTFPIATGTGITAQVMSSLQGVVISGATLKWATAPVIYTGTTSAAAAAASPTAATVAPKCGPGNWTNSTTFLCAYNTGATPNVITYIPVTVATGVAGSGTTIATDVTASTTVFPATGNTYTIAGFVFSQYQQGILLNNLVTSYATTTTATGWANTLQFYNLTSGATSTNGATAGGITVNSTNTYSSGQYSGWGIPFSSGWGLIGSYSSAANTYAAEWGTFYANGTTNGTKATFYSGTTSTASVFVDANGALWAGSYSLDDTAAVDTLATGYVGKLASQVYSSSSAGSLLVAFMGLISLVMAALFAF